MERLAAGAHFKVVREPLGSLRITPLSGVWATGLEYEILLAQGAAIAVHDFIEAERRNGINLYDERGDYIPSIDLRETLWPQKRT